MMHKDDVDYFPQLMLQSFKM